MNSNRLKLWKVSIIMLLTIFYAGCTFFGINNYETPKYEVLLEEGNKEIRYYEPYLVAKTTVKGNFEEAQTSAFRILADYIFGGNEKKEKIAMTGPVVQKPNPESEKIPMTSPVVQSPGKDGWIMTFMIPSSYKMEDLPKPKDKRVSFETIPARYHAAIRYSWYGKKSRNEIKAKELQDWLAGLKKYAPVSPPMYAGYNPPWTLPFFRRNEIMIEVEQKQ